VIAAAQAAILDVAVGEVGAAMRAAPVDNSVRPAEIAVQNEVLAEDAQRLDRRALHLVDRRDRLPVAAQQASHRRAGVDARKQPILFFIQGRTILLC
jgi:hypothetical protein